MNNDMEKVVEIAKEVGLNELAVNTAETIESVRARDKLQVALIGGQNSGKTTIINAICGKEVREASNISIAEEIPLRVTFERTEKDARFECVDVYDKAWNEENAVLFEFKPFDVAADGKLLPYANDIDVVFYLISAMNVFTSEDISTIKALKNHEVRLLLTKLDTIDEEKRDGVMKYVTDVRSQLGLGEPLIIGKADGQNISKIIRDALPTYAEQKASQDRRCAALLNELTEAVKEEIKTTISNMDAQLSENQNSEMNHASYSEALKAKNDIMRLGISRSKRYEGNTDLANRIFVKLSESGMQSKYSESWQANIEKDIIKPVISAEFESENEKLKKFLFEDCISINPSEEEKRKLMNKIDEVLKNSVHIDDGISLKSGGSSINYKTVGVTAAVVAGAFIIPLPTLAAWIVSAGAIAVGTGAVIAEKNKTEIEMWNKNMKDYSKVIAQQFCESMKIYNNEVYEKLADYVSETVVNTSSEIQTQEYQRICDEKEQYVKMLNELE